MSPGVVESLVYSRRHTHLVSCRDGVISNFLHKTQKGKGKGEVLEKRVQEKGPGTEEYSAVKQ